jgi:hypothetical protein
MARWNITCSDATVMVLIGKSLDMMEREFKLTIAMPEISFADFYVICNDVNKDPAWRMFKKVAKKENLEVPGNLNGMLKSHDGKLPFFCTYNDTSPDGRPVLTRCIIHVKITRDRGITYVRGLNYLVAMFIQFLTDAGINTGIKDKKNNEACEDKADSLLGQMVIEDGDTISFRGGTCIDRANGKRWKRSTARVPRDPG